MALRNGQDRIIRAGPETMPLGAIAGYLRSPDRAGYSLTVKIPGLPRSNAADNRHWRVKGKESRAWRLRVITAAKACGLPPVPLQHCAIMCERHSSVECDEDNLVYSFKGVIDSLTECGVIVDDSPEHVVFREYRWVRAKPKRGYIVLAVIDVGGEYESWVE